MSTIQIQITWVEPRIVLAAEETHPELHLFLGNRSLNTVVLPGDTRSEHTSTLELAAKDIDGDNTVLGIDCYTEVPNADGIPCKVKTGSHSIGSLLSLPKEDTRDCWLTHPADASIHKGTVRLHYRFEKRPKADTAADLDGNVFDRVIKHHVERFEHTFEPAHPIFAHILAPVFAGRLFRLPGIAFWMGDAVAPTDRCVAHLLGLALQRHDVTAETFAAEDPATSHLAGRVLAETLKLYPQALPYISDFAFARGRAPKPVEQFGNVFAQQSGDCEDYSRGICGMFEHIRFQLDPKTAPPLLAHLHHVSREYIALSVLGAVCGAKYDAAALNSDAFDRAHMFVKLLPLANFRIMRAEDPPSEGSASPLRTHILEGTCHLSSDFYDDDDPATAVATGLPPCFVQQQHASFTQCPFYKRDIHAYSNYFFADPETPDSEARGVFSFCARGTNTYGVPFCDPCLSPELVSLRAHNVFDGNADAVRDVRRVLAAHEAPPTVLDIRPEQLALAIDAHADTVTRLVQTPTAAAADVASYAEFLVPADALVAGTKEHEALVHAASTCAQVALVHEVLPTHSQVRVRMYQTTRL